MPPNITDSVAKLLSESGLRREQLVFSATHTHSALEAGPRIYRQAVRGWENKSLVRWIALQISRAVTSAISDLKPARMDPVALMLKALHVTVSSANRVLKQWFLFICLEQIGRSKAILGSFSAHATTLGPDNMDISADYPVLGTENWSWHCRSGNVLCRFRGKPEPCRKGDKFERSESIGEAFADSVAGILTIWY